MNLSEIKGSSSKKNNSSQSTPLPQSLDFQNSEIDTRVRNSTGEVGKKAANSTIPIKVSSEPKPLKFETINPSSPVLKRKKRGIGAFLWAHKILIVFLLLLTLGFSFYYGKLNQLKNTGLEGVGVLDPFKVALNAIGPAEENPLKNWQQSDDRTNILVIGVDMRGSTGSLLTDSMMLLSYNHITKETAQISFPRDLGVNFKVGAKPYNGQKLNSVFPYTYQETKSYDASFENLGGQLEKISGLSLHYGVMINFNGFQKLIDAVGGITVNVENSFIDCTYPNEDGVARTDLVNTKRKYGCPTDDPDYYNTIAIEFTKGQQKMNGKTALKYARSRHGNNGEASDFMRARRQQIIFAAVKEKVISGNFFTKLDTFNSLTTTLGENIKFYELGTNEIASGVKARDILKDISLYSMIIDPKFGGVENALLLGGDRKDGTGYRVLPVSKDYMSVQEMVSFFLNNSFLLKENPKVLTAWTTQGGSANYNGLVKDLKQSNIEIAGNPTRVIVSSTNISGTPIPTVITTIKPSVTSTVSVNIGIYKIDTGKDKSLEYFKNLLTTEGYLVTVKEKDQLPKELEKLAMEKDFLIVVE